MARCVLSFALIAPLFLVAAGCTHRVAPPAAPSPQPKFRFVLQRPISAPALLKTTRFTDVAAQAGLAYAWKIEGGRPLDILQGIGNGCAFLDYDNDGNLDILLIGTTLALYRGGGKGKFADMTQSAGLAGFNGHYLGCAVGDYDGDGFPDLYLSGRNVALLLHNEQGTRFADQTQQAGLTPQAWGTSCAFAETVPGSGRLDLFVGNYVAYDPEKGPVHCTVNKTVTGCGPLNYPALKGVFYRNTGGGKFTEATSALGFDAMTGKTLGAVFFPGEESGRPRLALANDEAPGDLFVPQQGKYVNQGQEAGVAFDRDGNVHGGMGIDAGDCDNDGRLDLFVATFQNEPRSLYLNMGNGQFSDRATSAGLAGELANFVGFGGKFFDYDNDGWLDLIIANGHIQDNIKDIYPFVSYRQPTNLLHNTAEKSVYFENVSASSPDLQRPIVGRGLAIGDFDNDGRIDALVTDAEGAPLLLHNESVETGHWLGVKLLGTKSNTLGYGARLTLEANGRKWLRYCHADGSYLSSSDPRVHFGLGKLAKIDRLTIQWTSGLKEIYRNLPIDRYHTLREGEAKNRRSEQDF